MRALSPHVFLHLSSSLFSLGPFLPLFSLTVLFLYVLWLSALTVIDCFRLSVRFALSFRRQ